MVSNAIYVSTVYGLLCLTLAVLYSVMIIVNQGKCGQFVRGRRNVLMRCVCVCSYRAMHLCDMISAQPRAEGLRCILWNFGRLYPCFFFSSTTPSLLAPVLSP